MPHRIFPSIAVSDKYNNCSLKAQLLYLTLFAFVDDFGTFTAQPQDIKYLMFPRNKTMTIKQIIVCEEALLESGLCIFYVLNEKIYLQMRNFNVYQVFGEGYNRTPRYPPYEEKEHSRIVHIYGVLDPSKYQMIKNASQLFTTLQSASHTTTSYTNTYTNTNTYKIEDIDNLEELNKEEKAVLKCFIQLSYKIDKEHLQDFKNWLVELKKDYPSKDLVKNALKWRDYFDQKPPKRHKNSFRNWVEKPYADAKSPIVVKLDADTKKFNEMYKPFLKK